MIKRKPYGYWTDPENIISEARKFMKIYKREKLPSKNSLYDLGYSSLSGSITKFYPGGYEGLRRDLGEKNFSKPRGYWQNPKNIEKEVKSVMIEHELSNAPSADFLRGIGRYDIATNVIRNYPGKFPGIRRRLGENVTTKPLGYWQDINNAKREAQRVIKEYGYLPSKRKLSKTDSSLVSSIVGYHGGFRKFRKLIGQNQQRRPAGYWKNPKNIIKEVRKFKKETGFSFLPESGVLSRLGYSYLASAIFDHYPGGLKGYRNDYNDYTPHGNSIKNGVRITTEEDFTNLIETEKTAKMIIERFGGDDADVADIISVVYEGRITREDALNFLSRGSLSKYLGQFTTSKPTLREFTEAAEGLLKLDKDGVIQGVISRRFDEYRRERLGPNPTPHRKRVFLRELEAEREKYRAA